MAVIPNRFTLVEYIRRLESQQYLFATDPARVNALVKEQGQAPLEAQLYQRAQWLDSDQHLQNTIAQSRTHSAWLWWAWCWLWLVLGVVSAVGLMQASALNFFYVWLCVLGMNALMLLVSCWGLIRPASSALSVGVTAVVSRLFRRPEQQVLWQLYQEQLQRPVMKWWWAKLSHQLWLASLGGMFLGMVAMLLVRQYTFNWQSTLLDSQTLSTVVGALSWLPSVLGLNVPDAHTVMGSERLGDVAFSKQWAHLLWSSLLLYGLLPRALAWMVCHVQSQKIDFVLPVQLPYYQRLKRLWQHRIVDSAANYQADAIVARPLSESAAAAQEMLVAAWEVLPSTDAWPRPVNQTWVGVVDDREQQAQLLARLQKSPCALTIWIRVHSVPDRGVMRRLNDFADHAQAGLTVCLWQEYADDERLQLWQQALNEQAIVWQLAGGE